MSNNKSSTKSNRGKGGNAKSSFSALPIVVFLVGAGVLIWLIMGTFSSPEPPATKPAEIAGANTATNTVEEAAEEPPSAPEPLSDGDRQKLLGKWERTDNPPYTIEVRSVKPDGVTDARYFNPRPINVAEGFIVGKDGKLAFFIKMQDRGYEGSTYTLVYDEDQDLLMGEYFQATQRQTYEVAFQRVTK